MSTLRRRSRRISSRRDASRPGEEWSILWLDRHGRSIVRESFHGTKDQAKRKALATFRKNMKDELVYGVVARRGNP